jgi:hypothetical protein
LVVKSPRRFGVGSPGGGPASGAVSTATGGVSWLFWTVLSPVLAIFEYVRFFLFGNPQSAAEWRPPSSGGVGGGQQGQARSSRPSSSTSVPGGGDAASPVEG